jgi:peptidoglycan/LPS O-acetylase OafA/YrhL
MGFLRFFLALSVAVWHLPGTPFKLLYPCVAVICFFMISGFYMAMVLTEKYNRPRDFYWSRFLRLYPAYAAMAAFMVFWYQWTGHSHPSAFASNPQMPWSEQTILALLNIGVFGQDLFELTNHLPAAPVRALVSDRFFDTQWMLVGQAWSLSSEGFFYLLAPFVVRSPWRIGALIAASLFVRVFLLGALDWPWEFGYWFVPSTFVFFMLGSLSYHLYQRFPLPRMREMGFTALAFLFGWMVWQIVVKGIALPAGPQASVDQPQFWVFYVAFALIVPLVFSATKDIAIDRWIGELSYPLYLCHGIVQGYLFSKYGKPYSLLAASGMVSASIAVAIVLWFAIDRNVDRWRHIRRSNAIRVVPSWATFWSMIVAKGRSPRRDG